MFTKILDQIGDFNPQLFRELKGNFKNRNLILSLTITLIIQVLMFSTFSENNCIQYDPVNNICQKSVWNIEWQSLFKSFNYLIPFIAYLGGVYQITSDLSKEQSRGTLNFIRLTPQSSYRILLGKILGVPSLIYLGILLSIPLHFIAGINSQISIFWLLGMYSLWIAGGLLFAIFSVFYTLLITSKNNSFVSSNTITGFGCLIPFLLGIPYTQLIDFSHQLYHPELYPEYYHYYQPDLTWFTWFLLPLGSIPFLAYLWLIISILTLTYWFWEAVNRNFNNPNNTPLSKIQGYGLINSFQIWLLGFLIPTYQGGIKIDHFALGFAFIFTLIPICYLILISSITPHRQNLLDWARYRHKMNENQPLWQDLLIGEKSPSFLAIAVNGLVTFILWSSWVFLIPKEQGFNLDEFTITEIILALILTINIGLIYAIIIQHCLLMKTNKREIFAAIILGIVIILPVSLSIAFTLKIPDFTLIWTLSPVPICAFIKGGIPTFIAGFFIQIGILSWLTSSLIKKLKIAGESETKSILASQ